MTPTVRRSVGGWSTWSHAVAFDAPGNNANLKDKNKKEDLEDLAMLHHVEIVTERPKGEKEGKRDMTVNRFPSK